MTYTPLTYEEFLEVNEVELNEIFAITGRTLELDFEPEYEAIHIYERPEVYGPQYGGLTWHKV